MALSKPKLPLGVERIEGKRKCVLFEPYETEEAEMCCVCLSPHPWGQHCDLPCLHTVCYVCLRKLVVEQVRSRGLSAPWNCPMCRKDLHSCAQVLPSPESVKLGEYRTIHFVEDYFSNWIVIVAEDRTGSILAAQQFKGITASQMVWINPYHGWFIKNGSPNNNPMFEKIPY